MFDVRLANTFDAKFLNQADDMVQLRSDVGWKGVKFREDGRVQDLDAPAQRSIIPVVISKLDYTAGLRRTGGSVSYRPSGEKGAY